MALAAVEAPVVVASVVVAVGYALGMVPTAMLVCRRAGVDPTAEGSGNPGASNVYRTAGRRAAALVLAGDMCKGVAAAALGWLVGGHLLGLVAGAAAVIGHVLPIGRSRRGGKGVATAAGSVLVLFPVAGVVAALVWVGLVGATRRPSVASLGGVAAFTAVVVALGAPAVELGLLGGLAALVVLRHAGNIARLAQGTEGRIEAGSP